MVALVASHGDGHRSNKEEAEVLLRAVPGAVAMRHEDELPVPSIVLFDATLRGGGREAA